MCFTFQSSSQRWCNLANPKPNPDSIRQNRWSVRGRERAAIKR
jgi:hypothetical protein